MKSIIQLSRKTTVAVMALVLLLSLSGCKKFLDTQRQGGYDEENYPYPGGSGPYDQFIFGAYNELRSFDLHSQSFITAVSIRSDDADKGSTPADGGPNASSMDNFPVLASNGFCNTLWLGNYSLITRCNSTIKAVNTNTTIVASEEIKQQTLGEARFLRAYAYFNLVRFFGRVPLIDTLFSDPAAQNNVLQSSAAQIYAFIEADLNFAASVLPLQWGSQFPGRVTKGSANGLLAKVYLTQQKWAQAMAAANTVISSGQYDLSTPYDKIFREDGENSKESVFEVQATASAAIPTNNGVQYAQIQGVRGAGAWDLGWGWNTPSDQLVAAYEANDPRRTRTILYTSTTSVPGLTIYGETTPTGLPNPRYNNKVYSNPALRASIGNRFGYWMNVRILRYADVVLMYAEAANEVGGDANITAARNALNSIRARARQGAPAGTLPDVVTTDQATLRTAIRQERRVELAMEHDRFFDIVRWGIAQDVLQAAGKTAFSNNRDVLLPIPQTQIDLSGGKLTQNPFY
ncbi:MAG: RagB/SusD family nutrient uptake outer membrane protein [Chitinophagaceae bacterium]|nr:RagB/SusD family nutrient uptake outer membrane protein [Chitinophagaceae bacterium]